MILLFVKRYLLVKQRTLYQYHIVGYNYWFSYWAASHLIVLLSSFNALESMIYEQGNFRPELLIESIKGRLFKADSIKGQLEEIDDIEHLAEVYEGYAFLQIPHTYMDSSATKNVVVQYRGVDKSYDDVYALSSILTEGYYMPFEQDSLALYMGRNLFAEHKLYFQDWPYLYAPTEDVLPEDIARWNGYVRLSTPGQASLGDDDQAFHYSRWVLFLTGDEQFDVHYVFGDIDHLRKLNPSHKLSQSTWLIPEGKYHR